MAEIHSYYKELLALTEELNQLLKAEDVDDQDTAALIKERKELREKIDKLDLNKLIAQSDNPEQKEKDFRELFEKLERLNQENRMLGRGKIEELKNNITQTKKQKESNAKFNQGVKNPRVMDLEG